METLKEDLTKNYEKTILEKGENSGKENVCVCVCKDNISVKKN